MPVVESARNPVESIETLMDRLSLLNIDALNVEEVPRETIQHISSELTDICFATLQHADLLVIPDNVDQRCLLALKITKASEVMFFANNSFANQEFFDNAIEALLYDILNNPDTELSAIAKSVLQDYDVTNYVLSAKAEEWNKSIKDHTVAPFMRALFRARHVSDHVTDKIIDTLYLGDCTDYDNINRCLDVLTEIITAPIIELNPNPDGPVAIEIDTSHLDRTKIPDALHRIFGISNFGTYNYSTLIRNYLHYTNGSPMNNDHPTALLRTGTDWNGALEWGNVEKEDVESLSRNGVIRIEVDSMFTIARGLLQAYKLSGGPLESVILAAHGNSRGLQLNHHSKEMLTRKRLLQHAELVKKLVAKCLTPDATIHIAACDSGHKKGVAYTLWKLTGHEVTGSRDTTSISYYQPSKGPLRPVYSAKPIVYPARKAV